jgi:Ca2+-binding RTX toxin-like protein
MPINYVNGTDGNDWIDIAYKNPVSNGVDYVYGWEGQDWIFGLGGADFLEGGGGNDHLFGGDENDLLHGGGGADDLWGGPGSDTAWYNASSAGVTVSLLHDSASGGDAAGDELDSIENLRGSSHADTLLGDNADNELHGLSGNDTLKGYGGTDTLRGGIGNDFLYGLDNSDILYGEDGNDTLYGGAGHDIVNGGPGIDSMIGGPGDDHYYVDNAGNLIVTGDQITESGGEGLDTVRTTVSWTLTTGADVEYLIPQDFDGSDPIDLTGNETANVVFGNHGANVLNGGGGDDELTGQGGADSFLFNTALNAATNVDVITDFNIADDTIRLDDDIFSSGLTANNSVADSQFVIGAAALDAGDRIIYNDVTGAVYYDSDGTGGTAQIQFATLDPGLALTNFDFLVVA